MFKKVALLAVAGLAISAQGASATDLPSNLIVTATISGTCLFTTPNTVAFPTNITTTGTQIDIASVNMNVNCTAGIPYTIGMDFGQNQSGGVRRMTDGTNFLRYDIFRDNARTQSYSAIGGGSVFSGTGAGAVTVPVFPSILVQTTPPAAAYTDTIIATLRY